MKLVSKSIIVNENEDSLIIPHGKLSGRPITIKLRKRVGMEKEELLSKLTQEERQQQREATCERYPQQQQRSKTLHKDTNGTGKDKDKDKSTEDKEGEGALGSLWNNLFGGNGGGVETVKMEYIDDGSGGNGIYASGHLYERLLKIMMISVLSNTEASHVKLPIYNLPQEWLCVKHGGDVKSVEKYKQLIYVIIH